MKTTRFHINKTPENLMKLANSLLALLVMLVLVNVAYAQTTSNMYVITLNGQEVTIDGDASDWTDAQFIFMSQDMPHGLYIDTDGENEEFLSGPDDFSGYVAMKMDMDNMYFAAKIRDDLPLIYDRPDSLSSNLFNTEHMGFYLGLYDIGDLNESPHSEVVNIIDPMTNDTLSSGRTYRVAPGLDDSETTLGADYQIGVHLQTYGTELDNGAFYAEGDAVVNHNYGYLGVNIPDTEVAILLDEEGTTYFAEWKVPFASLAGQLVTDTTNGLSAIEWPLYTPTSGDVIPFDIDLTDDDRIGKDLGTGGNDFLRYGTEGALWQLSYRVSGRGLVRDAATIGRANYMFGLYSPNGADDIEIDGDLSDWREAHFVGISQDTPAGVYIDTDANNDEFLSGPDDFSGFVSIRLDNDNMYVAAKVRDDLPVLYELPDSSSGVVFNTEHLALYLGLYDIMDLPMSPHNGTINIIDPATGDTLGGGRHYRVRPGWDDISADSANATLGPDYQIGVHVQAYGTTLDNGAFYASGDDVVNHNYGYLGVDIPDNEVAILFSEEGDTYNIEWKVPFSSLAGQLQPDTTNMLSRVEWPLFTPSEGAVIPFDVDMTDDDRISKDPTEGGNDFLRFGMAGDLWFNTSNMGWRLEVTEGPVINRVSIEEIVAEDGELPQSFSLDQNYPNPFNPTTTIEFDVSVATQATLKVYNLLGQEVATLVDGNLQPNRYQVTFDASGMTSGIYFYRLEAGDQFEVRKMVLLK